MHLSLAFSFSLITAIIAFRSAEIEQQIMNTFIAYYLVLGFMTVMFKYRAKLTNPKTFQLLQFSFFLMGFVLMMTGVLGVFAGTINMAAVFLLILFVPGLATIRAALHFNKNGE